MVLQAKQLVASHDRRFQTRAGRRPRVYFYLNQQRLVALRGLPQFIEQAAKANEAAMDNALVFDAHVDL